MADEPVALPAGCRIVTGEDTIAPTTHHGAPIRGQGKAAVLIAIRGAAGDAMAYLSVFPNLQGRIVALQLWSGSADADVAHLRDGAEIVGFLGHRPGIRGVEAVVDVLAILALCAQLEALLQGAAFPEQIGSLPFLPPRQRAAIPGKTDAPDRVALAHQSMVHLAGFEPPEVDLLITATRGGREASALIILGGDGRGRHDVVVLAELHQPFAGGDGEDMGGIFRTIAATGKHLFPIGRNGQADNVGILPRQLLDKRAIAPVPEADGVVPTPGEQISAIRGKGGSLDLIAVPLQHLDEPARPVPESQGMVQVPGDQAPMIATLVRRNATV
uniref:Uncharacterized protein n=1 Tax=Candidatus Kentrum sp. LFY TaxID=2126342 RepID=A0A450WXW8_9GAMM|nr:MAG: hypothetical protein BECKLFY1418C_GA0070996_110412 [Candidatus Kentron sp. LFY]